MASTEVEPVIRANCLNQPRQCDEIVGLMIGGNQHFQLATVDGFGHTLEGFRFGALHVHFYVAHVQAKFIHGNGMNRVEMGVFPRQIRLFRAVSAPFSGKL